VRVGARLRDHPGPLPVTAGFAACCATRPRTTGRRRCWRHAAGADPSPVHGIIQVSGLVDGPPDMISARSRGLPAIAVPGDNASESEWARLFAGRHASVVFDCDRAGRAAAARIAADLRAAGVRGSIVDLACGRADGYDLTEWLAERESLRAQELRRMLAAADTRPRAGLPAVGR
jgi:Toprim-like